MHRGEILGIGPTGKFVQYAEAAVFSFRGDRIAEVWVLGDRDLFGLISQPDSSSTSHANPDASVCPARTAPGRPPPDPQRRRPQSKAMVERVSNPACRDKVRAGEHTLARMNEKPRRSQSLN
jgi:hypothetical protein